MEDIIKTARESRYIREDDIPESQRILAEFQVPESMVPATKFVEVDESVLEDISVPVQTYDVKNSRMESLGIVKATDLTVKPPQMLDSPDVEESVDEESEED